jgi:hypothetical protein
MERKGTGKARSLPLHIGKAVCRFPYDCIEIKDREARTRLRRASHKPFSFRRTEKPQQRIRAGSRAASQPQSVMTAVLTHSVQFRIITIKFY